MTPVHIRFGGYQPPASIHSKAAAVFGQALATRLGAVSAFCAFLEAALPAKNTTVLHGRKNACKLSVHKDPTAYGMYVSGASFRE